MPARGVAKQSLPLPILGALLLCTCTKTVELPLLGAPDGSPADGAPGTGGRAGTMGSGTGGFGGDWSGGGRGWSGGRGASDGGATDAGTGDASMGDGGTTDAGGSRGDGGSACMQRSMLRFLLRTSNIMFVVPRNESMGARFGGDGTRMAALTSSLTKLLMPLRSGVNVGYQEYPALDGCSNQGMCCAPGTSQAIPPAPKNFINIDRALDRCPSGTPTNPGSCVSSSAARPMMQALRTVKEVYDGIEDMNTPKHVVLIADGSPGCVGDDPATACFAAGAEVTRLANANVVTFVVTLGEGTSAYTCLDDLAFRGGMPRSGSSPTYNAQDPTALAAALGEVMELASAPACKIELLSPPGDVTKVSLWAGTEEIPYDPAGKEGWRFPSPSPWQIQVYGKWCRVLQQTERSDIAVWSGCAPCTTPVCK